MAPRHPQNHRCDYAWPRSTATVATRCPATRYSWKVRSTSTEDSAADRTAAAGTHPARVELTVIVDEWLRESMNLKWCLAISPKSISPVALSRSRICRCVSAEPLRGPQSAGCRRRGSVPQWARHFDTGSYLGKARGHGWDFDHRALMAALLLSTVTVHGAEYAPCAYCRQSLGWRLFGQPSVGSRQANSIVCGRDRQAPLRISSTTAFCLPAALSFAFSVSSNKAPVATQDWVRTQFGKPARC